MTSAAPFDAQVAELERTRPREPLLLRFDPFVLLAALGLLAAGGGGYGRCSSTASATT